MSWIKVEDRLPDERPGWSHSETVNLYLGDVKTVSTGAYSYLENKWDDYLFGRRQFKVTHWQPLPKPPKE